MSAQPAGGGPEVGTDVVALALLAAERAARPSERFVAAHHAALRVAASVVAARRPRLHGRESVWRVLARIEPVLAEWASYFESLQLTCRAVEAGAVAVVSERLADDLLRDATAFRDAVALVGHGGVGGRA